MKSFSFKFFHCDIKVNLLIPTIRSEIMIVTRADSLRNLVRTIFFVRLRNSLRVSIYYMCITWGQDLDQLSRVYHPCRVGKIFQNL